MKLILFDIDGTLLRCGPQVRRIFSSALREVFGTIGPMDEFDFAGRLDPGIVRELMTGAGLGETVIEERLPAMRAAYTERLSAELSAAEMERFGGVERLLGNLSARSDLSLGLLTGNWSEGAYTKLGRVGLSDFFEFGAFGGDGADRPDLLPVAWRRAEAHLGRRFTADQTLIVGDSVHDVRCGRAHDVPVLAVATGWTSRERLASAGATWVAPSLESGWETVCDVWERGVD